MTATLLFALLLVQPISDPTTLWTNAKQALDDKQFAKARSALLEAVKARPNDPALWFYLGISCNELNKPDEAIRAFEKAHHLAPDKADVDFDLGLLYWRTGDLGKAKEAYRAGLALDPKQTSALQNYSILLIKTGEEDKAIAPLKELKLVPEAALPSWVSLIECYVKTGDKESAAREVAGLLNSGLASADQQTSLAAMLVQEDDVPAADLVLRNSLRLDPNQPKAHAALGVILLNQKRYEEAASSLESAVHLDPDSSEYAMAFAESLLLWNRQTTLLVFLKSAESKFAQLPEFQYKLALAYYGVSEFSNAIQRLEKLLETNPPRQDQIRYILGHSYFAMGRYDEAEREYRRAIDLNPKDPSYHESLAMLLRKTGTSRLDEAILQLQRAQEFEPSDGRLALELGLCYESKGDWRQAETMLETAVQRVPGSVPAHVALARIYFHNGRKEEALKEKIAISSLERQAQQQRTDPRHASTQRITDDRIQ